MSPKINKYIVRLYDGFDGYWIDVSKPVSKEEADSILKTKTNNGSKMTQYSDIDYYAIFSADTRMLFHSR